MSIREDTLAAIDRTIATLTARLLESRNDRGYWEGRLASSPLSTATAVIALTLAAGPNARGVRSLVRNGVRWLVANQNADGGWGDTTISFSNLSTTALAWAALHVGRRHVGRSFSSGDDVGQSFSSGSTKNTDDAQIDKAIHRADCWLGDHLGGLTPDRLRTSLIGRYGKDRTFSVPILTALTLAGRLGDESKAWRHVPALPFELAACPHQWFQWLRLPVVSYALPALIALGQVRHHHRPTRNPILRPVRTALRRRTLDTLRELQPESGGYLEATPLTSFIVMSLVSSGETTHPVVEHGIRFLISSARPDGSWPVDTNLATWVTTLAVNAGLAGPPEGGRASVVDWLLGQQCRVEHPYTHAAPGGWGWTDLSGAVPDADDTAGALLALASLAPADPRVMVAAATGVEWLLGLQNRDGGIPTFCRGWGTLPFDRSAPDLTAHALRAWSAWHAALTPDLQRRVAGAARRAVTYLADVQNQDGSWSPLWFGNQHVTGEINFTYGTARVVQGLGCELARALPEAADPPGSGLRWLLRAQNDDGGWGGAPEAPSTIEETGVALQALASSSPEPARQGMRDAIERGARWLVGATGEGRLTPASPIGLYFARLWYFEELYPIVFALGGLSAARDRLQASGSGRQASQ